MKVLTAEEKTMQLEIDALKEAAAWLADPGRPQPGASSPGTTGSRMAWSMR